MADEVKAATTYEFLLGIADRFGVPCLILAAVLWMIRDAGMALHQTVVVPVVQAHTKFLDKTEEALDTIGKSQEKAADTMQAIATGQQRIESVLLNPTKNSVPN